MFGLDEVDTLVTDDGARPETLAAVRKRGVEVIVASGSTARRPARRRADDQGTVPTRSARARRRSGRPSRGRAGRRARGRQRAGAATGSGASTSSATARASTRASPPPRCTGATPAPTTHRRAGDRRGLRYLPAGPRAGRRDRRHLVVRRVQGRRRGRGARTGAASPFAAVVHVPGSTLTGARLGRRHVRRRPVHGPGHDQDVLVDAGRDGAPALELLGTAAGDALRARPPRRRGRGRDRDRRRRAAGRAACATGSRDAQHLFVDRRRPRATRPPSRRRSSSRRWRSSTPRARRRGR